MHRHKILARISLILSWLNFVLAAPILVQGIHEAPDDDTVVQGDVASPHSSPDATQMASPQRSSLSDGSTSSGYPSRYLSSGQSVSGYSWLLDRPPRLTLDIPPSVGDSAIPHTSTSAGSYGIRLPEWLQELTPGTPPSPDHPESLHDSDLGSPHPSSQGSSDIQLPEWVTELAPEEVPQSQRLTESLHDLESHHHSSTGLSEIQFPEWMEGLEELAPEEVPQSPQHTESEPESNRGSIVPYSTSDGFTASHHPSSLSSTDSAETVPTSYSPASGGSLSSHYFSASDGLVSSHHSIPEGSFHQSMSEGSLHRLMPEGLEPSSPPLQDDEKFFRGMIKTTKIVAGVAIVGGVIAGIVGSQIKHHKHRDFQDS
jgi:hypothetical protein